MKISAILQMRDLGIMFAIGVCLGIIYGIINIFNHIHENIITRIICDIIFMIIATFSYIIIVEKINFGSLRLYLLLGYAVGFVIERISLGKLFAKGCKNVYNKLKLIFKQFKYSKLGKIIFK